MLGLYSRSSPEPAVLYSPSFSWLTGLVKDECSLRDLNVTSGAKMMVVGSTIDDVITVQAPPTSSLRSEAASGGNHLFHTNLHCIISHIHTYTMGM